MCPGCGSKNLKKLDVKGVQYKCLNCGFEGNSIGDLK